jgi:hypothetical protein
MAGQGLDGMVKPRTHSGGFAHNKFLVLSRGGAAEPGLDRLDQPERERHLRAFEQRPLGARREGRRQVRALLARSSTTTGRRSPRRSPTRRCHRFRRPAPRSEIDAVFSPRRSLDALDAYAAIAGACERALFMTFAFGMNERFVPSFDRTDAVIRFALMDKKGSGKTFAQQAAEIDRIRKHPNVTVAVGQPHRDQPIRPLARRARHDRRRGARDVRPHQVHARDPLGPSRSSSSARPTSRPPRRPTTTRTCSSIRGNAAVADIYLGEFMRLFSHYAFRESLTFKGATTPAQALLRKYLIDSPRWIDGDGHGKGYFDADSDRTLRRLYFSRPMSHH